MDRKSKDRAYKKLMKLEDFFWGENQSGSMKKDEYDWIVSHINSIVSSIGNFDLENVEECKARMKTMGWDYDEEIDA